jgi:predicted cobalt transporter CbtA
MDIQSRIEPGPVGFSALFGAFLELKRQAFGLRSGAAETNQRQDENGKAHDHSASPVPALFRQKHEKGKEAIRPSQDLSNRKQQQPADQRDITGVNLR